MNKDRRRQLRQWNKKAEALKDELENILWDEQNYYDNIPENLQYSSRAEDSQEAIDCMEEAVEILGEAIDKVEEII
jgi:hypothetical protein